VGTEPLIRPATPDDLDAILGVFRRASLANEGDREWIDTHSDEFGIDESNVIEGRTRVAVVDGCIVGFATLVGNELEDLFTDPDWMRRGIAAALVRDAAGSVRRIGVTANSHARLFYEAVGFVHDGVTETPGGPAYRMHLQG